MARLSPGAAVVRGRKGVLPQSDAHVPPTQFHSELAPGGGMWEGVGGPVGEEVRGS